jgi:predicted small secreted protein
MRKMFFALAAVATLAGLSACNTMRGMGEDISALGRYISNSSGTSSSHHAAPPPAY